MKVMLITHYWKNSDGGGIKTYVANLVDALSSKGINISVIFRFGNDSLNFHYKKNKIYFCVLCLVKLIKTHPNIIHSQETWYCLAPGFIYKLLYKDSLLIHTFHSEPNTKISTLSKLFIRHLLNKCDYVTFVSKGLRDQIIETYDLCLQKTIVSYGGARLEKFNSMEIDNFNRLFNVKSDSIIILVQAFTANRLKSQGLKLVIQAIKLIREDHPNVILLVTRDGLYSNDLKTYADIYGVRDSIIFTGDVENPFIPISVSNIFIFPWLGDGGVGLALLEAMAYGLPTIVFDNGNKSEIIEDGLNGILVKPDIHEIAQKIDLLIHNEELAYHLGERAKKTIRDKFTWEKVADQFIKLYGESNEFINQ